MTDTSSSPIGTDYFGRGQLLHDLSRRPVTIFDAMNSDWARPIVHWSITALDPERQRAFYAELFNWEIGDGPFMQVAAGVGGPEPGPAGHIQAGATPGTSLYVQVADLRTTIDR